MMRLINEVEDILPVTQPLGGDCSQAAHIVIIIIASISKIIITIIIIVIATISIYVYKHPKHPRAQN